MCGEGKLEAAAESNGGDCGDGRDGEGGDVGEGRAEEGEESVCSAGGNVSIPNSKIGGRNRRGDDLLFLGEPSPLLQIRPGAK